MEYNPTKSKIKNSKTKIAVNWVFKWVEFVFYVEMAGKACASWSDSFNEYEYSTGLTLHNCILYNAFPFLFIKTVSFITKIWILINKRKGIYPYQFSFNLNSQPYEYSMLSFLYFNENFHLLIN